MITKKHYYFIFIYYSIISYFVKKAITDIWQSQNFEGMQLIRPMYLIREDDIIRWRDHNSLTFLKCACKFTEECSLKDDEENLSKRLEIKKLISDMKKNNPDVENHIFRSVENINLDTVIAYKENGKKHSFLDTYDLKEKTDDNCRNG